MPGGFAIPTDSVKLGQDAKEGQVSTASVQVVRGVEVELRIRVEKLVDPRVLL